MKQYDSHLILGCHFPKQAIDIIKMHSSIHFFNTKIRALYNCEIIEVLVPITENVILTQYYLKICLDQSENSILRLNQLDGDTTPFKEVLKTFELDEREPYLIAIPIVRLLNNE